MPYKCEKIKMPNELKRSYKLTEQDKEDIKYIRANSSLGYRKIAALFGVSKRRIQQICNPEVELRNKKRLKELQKDGRYYKKDRHREYMKSHRHYKHGLYKSGFLKEE